MRQLLRHFYVPFVDMTDAGYNYDQATQRGRQFYSVIMAG
jgi:hypothetical protein